MVFQSSCIWKNNKDSSLINLGYIPLQFYLPGAYRIPWFSRQVESGRELGIPQDMIHSA